MQRPIERLPGLAQKVPEQGYYAFCLYFPNVERKQGNGMEAHLTLLESVKSMDREALAQTFELYAPALYNYALRCSNDPQAADNIVGDVFARLLEKLACNSGPQTNLRSYLFEIAHHLIVDDIRYNGRHAPVEIVDRFHHDAYTAHDFPERRILFEKVLQAIRNDLNDAQRHVVVLRFLEGFSLKETAAILGKSLTLVKVTQLRAIRVLRKSLVEHVVE
jgi:RNA polymerase sigma-70 factor, ECF subfamily